MSELFGPDTKFCGITFKGEQVQVPEGEQILRCLQYLYMEGISYGSFCWNGICLNCKISYTVPGDDQVREALACQTIVIPGMNILSYSDEMSLCVDM